MAVHNPPEIEEFISEDITYYRIGGIFKVTKREREGKLPVLHLNPIPEPPDGLWVELKVGGLHDSSSYSPNGECPLCWVDRTYSGGGSTVSNLMVGFMPLGSLIKYYEDSYKGRKGARVSYLKVTDEGLQEYGGRLADGLTIDDLQNPEKG